MEPAILGALSAILGSAVGGSATMATAWLTQRTQGRREHTEAEIRKREGLYVEFINEGSKRMLEAFEHQLKGYDQLFTLYSIMNRIRLRSSEEVLTAADRACNQIIEQFFKPNLSDEQMRELVLTRTDDPLKGFSEACRRELRGLDSRV